MYKKLKALIGRTGIVLFVLLGISLVGTLITAVVIAPLAAIPLIQLVAIPFFPIPTISLYLSIICFVYILVMALPLSRNRSTLALAGGLLAALGIGFIPPKIANQNFDTMAAKFVQQGQWRPVSIVAATDIALVRSQDTELDNGCSNFCLALLLSGKAKSVTIMTVPELYSLDRLLLTGTQYRLTADVETCLSRLSDIKNPRLAAEETLEFRARILRNDFRQGLLNPEFEKQVITCLDTNLVQNAEPTALMLVNWQVQSDEDRYHWPMPSLNSRIGVIDRRNGAPSIIDLSEIYGTRMDSPLWISPFGGNAATGGTFSPKWSRSNLNWDGPDVSSEGWWSYLADPNSVVDLAIERIARAQELG